MGELDRDLAVESLANGSETTSPLNGYQFIPVHSEDEKEPDTIWLKGDDTCPAYAAASQSYRKSAEYISTLDSSREFYLQFTDVLSDVMPAENVTYAQAYNVFDLLNVGSIHNEFVASRISASQLSQLRYYADQYELGHNYNLTQTARSIGGMTLMGAVLRQLNQTISSEGALKLSLMAGSYDTFLAFFGLTNLTATDSDFMGLPSYASSMAFELYTEENVTTFPSNTADLRVRFLFRNGTEPTTPLTAFPLFSGGETSLSYNDFRNELGSRAINSVEEWCSICQSEDGFCSQKDYMSPTSGNSSSINADSESRTSTSSGLTTLQAGMVGAMTTFGVLMLAALVSFLIFRTKTKPMSKTMVSEKRLSDSGSGGGISA